MGGGEKTFPTLSLLFRGAVEIIKVLSARQDDHNFQLPDKNVCDNHRAARSKDAILFDFFFSNPGSHLAVYFGLIVTSGSIPPPFALSVRGTIPTVALPGPVHR